MFLPKVSVKLANLQNQSGKSLRKKRKSQKPLVSSSENAIEVEKEVVVQPSVINSRTQVEDTFVQKMKRNASRMSISFSRSSAKYPSKGPKPAASTPQTRVNSPKATKYEENIPSKHFSSPPELILSRASAELIIEENAGASGQEQRVDHASEAEANTDAGSDSSPSPLFEARPTSIWKRLSQTSSMPSLRSIRKKQLDNELSAEAVRSKSESNHQESTYLSEDTPSAMSEISEAPTTPEDSTINFQMDEAVISGLAGIGVRDRSSISLSSPTAKNLIPDSPKHKNPPRSGMNYAPSNSSPLSSRVNTTTDEISEVTTPKRQSTSRPTSSLHPPQRRNRDSYRSERLYVVPDHTAISSDDLMKILRGPSSYPIESIPGSNRNSAIFY